MLEVKDLTYCYSDGTVAIEDISMDFDKGEIVGVIGANGAGKSTLFMNILGLLKPTKGHVLLDGEPIRHTKSYLAGYRQKVNMVFQDPDKQIFFSRVYDDVAFALRNLKLSEEEVDRRVRSSLTKTGVAQFSEKPVHFLSYGQKKRVAIAGVLAMNCDHILLDEPTAGLDPRMTAGIVALIRELKAAGVKIILSSHDMNFVYDTCDYIYILKEGTLAGEGEKKEVFKDHEFIRDVGLEQPWLVEIAMRTDLPLMNNPEELYQYINKPAAR